MLNKLLGQYANVLNEANTPKTTTVLPTRIAHRKSHIAHAHIGLWLWWCPHSQNTAARISFPSMQTIFNGYNWEWESPLTLIFRTCVRRSCRLCGTGGSVNQQYTKFQNYTVSNTTPVRDIVQHNRAMASPLPLPLRTKLEQVPTELDPNFVWFLWADCE